MKKIMCVLPNASTSISGVTFEQVEGGMLSAAVDDNVAKAFAAIPGYQVFDADNSATKAVAEKAAADELTLAEAKAAKATAKAAAKAAAATHPAPVAEAAPEKPTEPPPAQVAVTQDQ